MKTYIFNVELRDSVRAGKLLGAETWTFSRSDNDRRMFVCKERAGMELSVGDLLATVDAIVCKNPTGIFGWDIVGAQIVDVIL